MTARSTTWWSTGPTGTTPSPSPARLGDVNVTGQAPAVELLHAEATDQLDFETFSGIDTVASGGLTAGAIQLFLDGVLIP